MMILEKIAALRLEIQRHLGGSDQEELMFEPALKEINQTFQTLSESEKANVRPALEEIFTLLNLVLKKEKEIQAGIKQKINAINKRSNAANAYQKTSNLGTYTR